MAIDRGAAGLQRSVDCHGRGQVVFSDGDIAHAQRTWSCSSEIKGRIKLEHLFDKLVDYAGKNIYPYHMPGHKRQGWGNLPEELYKIDITEIEDFDNLHQPEGILLELQKEAAGIYGAEESYYLVNGSTCGILSAVSCALPFGGRLLMARNCHKSAYHAAYLRHLRVRYLYPEELEEYDIADAITPGQVREALERNPDTEAVLIVSPTYEGRIADISAIAGIVHARRIPLIVDEAHGAHLGLAEGFPANSCQAGADLVIHSVHKTLPALTQTALLHVNGELIDRNLLRRFLHIYQSSSPSYLLMAGIDNALRYIRVYGGEAFERFRILYGKMLEKLSGCRKLRVLTGDEKIQDTGKLLISVKGTELTGKELYEILLQEYGLQTEMASESFVLAMFTINDRAEAYERMTEALLAIDERLAQAEILSDKVAGLKQVETSADIAGESGPQMIYCAGKAEKDEGRFDQMEEISRNAWAEMPPAGAGDMRAEEMSSAEVRNMRAEEMSLAEAWDMPAEEIPLAESAGRNAAEFINLYPPGVPLVVPGERMTQEICHSIQQAFTQGLNVQGVSRRKTEEDSGETLWVKVLRRNKGGSRKSGMKRA